ncbi:MAG: hypothetical protein K2J89_00215 [Clostridia bacterium]|nr:hypothetical protein [Clostridia bacterium]
MKKVIIITLLMTVIATLFIGGGVCYAEESQTNYYYVVKGNELSVRVSASEEAKIVMQIPSTYAFECIEKADGIVRVKYNGYEGYVLETDFNQKCKAVTSKWGEAPYFYTVPLNISNVNGDQLTFYNKETMASDSLPKSWVTLNNVYGYYRTGSDYYFLVNITVTVLGNTNPPQTGFIKASDTTLADFTKDSIVDSAGYVAETTPDKQEPDEDETPTINPGGSDGSTQPATNNFERYVLIAVIAVLCVVIIILIFAPNKSKRKS